MPNKTVASAKELREILKELTAGAHQLTVPLAAGQQFLKEDFSSTSMAVTASTSLRISHSLPPQSPPRLLGLSTLLRKLSSSKFSLAPDNIYWP